MEKYVNTLLSFFFKIEIKLVCDLSIRQKLLYQAVKNKISIEDLVSQSASSSVTNQYTNTLMNLVMQFRKVKFFWLESFCLYSF